MVSGVGRNHLCLRWVLRQLPITNFAHKAAIIGNAEMTAVVAALDMPAKRRGSAGLDRRHDLQLVEAQMPGLSGTVADPRGSEDIGDLERGGQ